MSSIYQGIYLSLVGILITFGSLGLLIVVIVLLDKVFNRSPKDEMLAPGETKEAENLSPVQDIDRMKAAGIAVAVAVLMSKGQKGSRLGKALEAPPGRWWGDDRIKES